MYILQVPVSGEEAIRWVWPIIIFLHIKDTWWCWSWQI